MKSPLEEFIQSRVPLPGLAAWSARFADQNVASDCYTPWFNSREVEQALLRLILAARSFNQYGVEVLRLCWTFNRARIHFAVRPDGACLALFGENRLTLPTLPYESLIEEFVRLPSA